MKIGLASTPTHLALGIARVGFFSVLFLDFAQLYHYRLLSFVGAPAWVSDRALPAALVAIAALAVGLGTRAAAIAAYALANVVYRHCTTPYHLDNYARAFLFLFVFAPAPRALALDLRLRRHAAEPHAPIPAWFYLAFFAIMEIVYADSVMFKLRSELWQRGLAFWMPAALPHFSTERLPDALEIGFLMCGASYLALALEICFPAILFRGGRRIVVLIGTSLHLGIAVFFPIPFFGIAVACAYLLFVDWPGLVRTLRRLRSAREGGEANADVSVGSSPTPVAIAPRDLIPAAVLVALHLLLVFNGSLPAAVRPWTERAARYSGASRHQIYVDLHFAIREPILRFEAKQAGRSLVLPSFDAKGYPEMSGRYWCEVSFSLRADGPSPSVDPRLRGYLGGLLKMQGVRDADIVIFAKDVWVPLELDFTADDEVERRPFRQIGTARYQDGVVTLW